jgi:hypothetical protein
MDMKDQSESSSRENGVPPEHEAGKVERRWRLARRRGVGVGVGVLIPVVGIGVAACGGSSSSSTTTTTASTAPATAAAASASGHRGFAGHAALGGRSNARSTNAAGGSIGTVGSVSASGFTLSPPKGGKVTVKETSSTLYKRGSQKASASAVTKGSVVLVIGTVNSTTITATEVIVNPGINPKSASANVIAFQQGASGSTKSVGQIPADYTQGSGKLVSGTDATKATEAALKAYAGGVVDRVVQLSNGDYEVHHIGVNWPHHIFVNKDFKVIGAND